MARKYLVGGKVYEETGARKVIVGGKVLEETTAAGGAITGTITLAFGVGGADLKGQGAVVATEPMAFAVGNRGLHFGHAAAKRGQ